MSMSMEVQVKPHVKTKDSKTNCVMISPSAFESLSRYVFSLSFYLTHTLNHNPFYTLYESYYTIYIHLSHMFLVTLSHTHMITQNEMTLTSALEKRSIQTTFTTIHSFMTHTANNVYISFISSFAHSHTHTLTQNTITLTQRSKHALTHSRP